MRFASHEAASPAPSAGGIVLPCYEGADGRETELTFSNAELCRSMLLLGSTGSGKTTALRAICRSLIRQRPSDAAAKPALILFDFKGDRQTIEAITAWAEQSGRGSDVRQLSLSGVHAYDCLGGFGGLPAALSGWRKAIASEKRWSGRRANAGNKKYEQETLTGKFK